jgi:Cu/Ag efflux protein CusF
MRAFTLIRLQRLLAIFSITLFLTGCTTKQGDAKAQAVKQFPMHGQILGLDPGQHVATIKHDEIPGFMGAMTMGYLVKDPAEFGKLSAGETFNGTVYVQGDDLWVGDIRKEPVKP